MEYVYGFTNDNKKVVIGTVEVKVQATGYTITLPSQGSNFLDAMGLTISINGETPTTWTSFWSNHGSVHTVDNVQTITITPSNGYELQSVNFVANTAFKNTLGDSTTSWSEPIGTNNSVIITILNNTVFSKFIVSSRPSIVVVG